MQVQCKDILTQWQSKWTKQKWIHFQGAICTRSDGSQYICPFCSSSCKNTSLLTPTPPQNTRSRKPPGGPWPSTSQHHFEGDLIVIVDVLGWLHELSAGPHTSVQLAAPHTLPAQRGSHDSWHGGHVVFPAGSEHMPHRTSLHYSICMKDDHFLSS